LSRCYQEIPNFPGQGGKIKISAAWLIEQAGWKGRQIRGVGMYEKQALILVNYGRVGAKQVLALVRQVKTAVRRKFAINLEEEVNII
jgi:UDP-N-acetylmuramate dehydrogenase